MAVEPVVPAPDASSPDACRRPGWIALARHGEPALSRRVTLNAEGYRRWWATYEEGGILPDQEPPADLRAVAQSACVVLASSRRRAVETARAVVGDRPLAPDPLFIEAPLPPPPLPRWLRTGPKTWGFVSRCIWWFLRWTPPGEETRAEAEARASRACDRLEATARTEGDVLLFAHGFFNAMLSRELKRRGWRQAQGRGWAYWSVKRFEPPASA